MTTKYFTDKSGCRLRVVELEGRLFPDFPLESLKSYRDLPLRDDDIILCGYPKSGTHWVWEVMMMLLRGQAETITFKKSLHMIEFNSAANIGEFQSPRVLNSHVLYADLPHEVHTRRLKIVFVCRNPKDVAVSLYNHHVKLSEYYEYSGEFKDWLELFVEGKVDYGSWFDYTKSWENVIYGDRVNPIHVVMYEDMKEDPSRETKRLADFLGVSCSSELISAVVTKCGFDHMKEDKKPHQNHSEVMFRKGVVGDWKNYFTVAQNEAFDAILAERMKGSKLQVRYQL